ncbi:hypothetical protein DPMN_089996 [Dreissena polymorpha]|uniref:Uncharacterized protein n=1 Tax=Dreissena polymorpha TaxID=45954 RepID=A0A9D4QZE3_DREPO|nr:hypothetical protein DPMN_089996 [Dreissena polymorpha]
MLSRMIVTVCAMALALDALISQDPIITAGCPNGFLCYDPYKICPDNHYQEGLCPNTFRCCYVNKYNLGVCECIAQNALVCFLPGKELA